MLNSLSRCRIDGSFDSFASIQLPVQLNQHEPEYRCCYNGNGSHDTVMDECARVSRLCFRRIQVTRINGSGVAYCVDKCQRSRSFRRWPRQCVADPRKCCAKAPIESRDLFVGQTCTYLNCRSRRPYHQHHANIASGRVDRGGRDDEAHDSEP